MIAAAYLRKSNDEGEKHEDAKSITRQLDRCREYAARKGWTLDERYVFSDDGISGAEFNLEKRPGFKNLMASLTPQPPFDVLIVSEQSRIGRDTIRTLHAIQQITDADVKIYSYLDDREITLADDIDEVQEFIRSWSSSQERKKAGQRVGDALRRRAERGHVAGGRVYGYTNERTNSHVERRINEPEAAVVRRIFQLTADGHGLLRTAKALNVESIPGPRARKWSASGVREILKRELYRGVVTYGKVQKISKAGTKQRVRVPKEHWLRHEAPELRIVSDELWQAAQDRIAETSSKYRRTSGGKLIGKPENLREGKFLLSGFLVCGAMVERAGKRVECQAPLIVVQRHGRGRVYVCRAHRASGDTACSNATGVPMAKIHAAVIGDLKETLTPDRFEALLRRAADDREAREARDAERARLLARIPELHAEAMRMADKIAAGHGSTDILLDAIADREKERKEAEARLLELEAANQALRADENAVKRLRAALVDWRGALEATPEAARQLLRVVFPAPVTVVPTGPKSWRYVVVSHFDGLLVGEFSLGRYTQGTQMRGTPITKARTIAAHAVPSGALGSAKSAMNPL